VVGFLGLGAIAEDQLRIGRNKLHVNKASGDIVLVKIDDASLQQIGRWPWPRRYHAQLVDKLTAAGARRIFFDIVFEEASRPSDDELLAAAIKRSNRVTLPLRGEAVLDRAVSQFRGPVPMFGRHAQLSSIAVHYNYQNAIWRLSSAVPFQGSLVPSMAASLAGKEADTTASFPVDYSIDPMTFPKLSAGDVLSGRFRADELRGKHVIIATDSAFISDRFFIPGVGHMAGVYVHMLGAETLKSGQPVSLGWPTPFLTVLGICCLAVLRAGLRTQLFVLASLTLIVSLTAILLEANLIFVDVAPALFVTMTLWSSLLWRRYKKDGVTNAVSGLPNLTALKACRQGREQALVAARVLNYAEIVASLPSVSERALVEQIVSRLTVGSTDKAIYHGDGGIFGWFEEPRLSFGHHIDALHSLFRNPVRVNGQAIDVSLAFGAEVGSARSLPNRLASALVAAEEAARDGLKWKIHDPEKLNDASWKLSLLSRLDQAIDEGEVWVAYQPKLDLQTREIIGAEALARWTHPEKGPIAASEFIAAAEHHDRIGKLTDFVLNHAIASAAAINRSGRDFNIAVNLSARLLGDKGLKSRLSAMILKHLLDPARLTLELTETSSMTSADALQLLEGLRDLGVKISIDDYGTGLSTLDYLKKVPASEIKIDQSFVRGMIENRSDRVMVQSTIALAHSLNRSVVAEGVETREVLDALIEMKCDVAQGFIIGRPMSFESLRRRLTIEAKRSAVVNS
jgi:EAL domain-containing protein (putative c-di-GMP-specific phosphodiesterase class I)/CHASE2 domain-containing sensor protein